MIYREHDIQFHPCPQGYANLSLGRMSGTHPPAENIDDFPEMMQIFSMQTFAGRQHVIALDIPSRQNLKFINKKTYK